MEQNINQNANKNNKEFYFDALDLARLFTLKRSLTFLKLW